MTAERAVSLAAIATMSKAIDPAVRGISTGAVNDELLTWQLRAAPAAQTVISSG